MSLHPFAPLERRLLYPSGATRPVDREPTLTLHHEGETLHGWAANPRGSRCLLYFGGNGERVEGTVGPLAAVLTQHAVNAAAYRGYGPSTGTPSEHSLVADALAWFDDLSSRYSSIDVVGRSLGSGVAVQVAAQRPVRRLVLVTPFDSLINVAADVARPLPIGWLVRDRYESVRHTAELTCPVLVLRASDDTMVRPQRTAGLVASFATPPEEVVIAGRGHNDLQLDPAYDVALRRFLR